VPVCSLLPSLVDESNRAETRERARGRSRCAFCRTTLARVAAALAMAVVVPSETAWGQNQVAPNAAAPGSAASGTAPPQNVPFELSPEEFEQLDRVLTAWEQQSSRIATFTANFTIWEYDGVFISEKIPAKIGTGEIKYKKPDKGMYRVKEVKLWEADKNNPEQGEHIPSKEPGDHWVCDGKSVFEYDYKQKHLIERPLPPELQGKAIANGPLPFMFGAEKRMLLDRYLMRVITPPNVEGQIWLVAYPRYQQDAANFVKAEIILAEQNLLPLAVQLYLPNLKSRTVYQFTDHNINENFLTQLIINNWFSAPRTPFGWKRVVEQPPANAPPQTATVPGAPPR